MVILNENPRNVRIQQAKYTEINEERFLFNGGRWQQLNNFNQQTIQKYKFIITSSLQKLNGTVKVVSMHFKKQTIVPEAGNNAEQRDC